MNDERENTSFTGVTFFSESVPSPDCCTVRVSRRGRLTVLYMSLGVFSGMLSTM